MRIYNNNAELIADGEQARGICASCPYHEINVHCKHICQISNEEITEDFECQQGAN